MAQRLIRFGIALALVGDLRQCKILIKLTIFAFGMQSVLPTGERLRYLITETYQTILMLLCLCDIVTYLLLNVTYGLLALNFGGACVTLE